MKLYLNIDNRWETPEMDRNENELQLNYNFASLESPADYIGEFAMDFKIPRTQNNNRLFEQYFRVDSVVTQNNGYNPAIKIPYRILDDNGEIISEGSGYINNVTKTDYIFALQGAMFNIFSKALNSGWNTTAANEDDEYYLMDEYLAYDGQTYLNSPVMTANLIKWSWKTQNNTYDWDLLKQRYNNLNPDPDTRQEIFSANCIGWIPTHQGTAEGAKTDKWVAHPNKNPANGEELLPMWSYNSNEVNFPLADEPTEYQMAEFRSWNQQPCIYLLRLWQWYKENFYNITGYNLYLDESFFNEDNPLFTKLVYTLPKLGKYTANNADAGFSTSVGSSVAFPVGDLNSIYLYGVNGLSLTDTITFPQGFNGGSFIINWQPKVVADIMMRKVFNYYEYAFIVTIQMRDNNNNLKKQKKVGFVMRPYIHLNDGNFPQTAQHIINYLNNNTDDWGFYFYSTRGYMRYNVISNYVYANQYGQGININFGCDVENGDYMTIKSEIYCPNEYAPYMFQYYEGTPPAAYWNHNTTTFATEINVTCNRFFQRTGQPVTLERLFKNDKPFEILLKYTKYLNMVWLIDEKTKTVKVQPRQQYFYDCLSDNSTLTATGNPNIPINGILDLTNKVNYAKDIKVLPIDWTDKEIYLNFDESDADFLKTYNESYKRTYGSKVLITPNKRTKSRKEFFDKLKVTEAADVTPYFINIGSCYNGHPTAYKADRLLLNTKDDQKKSADLVGQFVFRNPNSGWSPDLFQNFRNAVIISDDTNFEIDEEKVYYHGSTLHNDVEINDRPIYSPVYTPTDTAFWFAFPRDAYAPINYAQTTATLFDRWQGYLYEIFNINNKTIEVYINLDSTTYKRLKQNPLCQIDNCVYIMMQMAGFNENTEWVKCTLKQFGSVDNLTAGAVENLTNITDVWLWDNNSDTKILWDDLHTINRYDKDTILPLLPPVYPPIIDPDTTPVLPATPIPYDQPTIINYYTLN